MILVVDNYDSFVHNLARYARLCGAETNTVRNDAASVDALIGMKPQGVILSPGPKSPKEAGVSLELLRRLPREVPVLGVCLGHQCLVEAFGGWTRRADRPLHGEASPVHHSGTGLFAGLPSPLAGGRYHSLISVVPEGGELLVDARSADGEVMAVRRRSAPWFGLQFHPESLLTPNGRDLVGAFVRRCAP
jgi:anthranilate synthase/aminodeoxychorismate synthase-like glutamine amidotransferase